MRKLTFDALRAANVARLPLFKNRHGIPAHSKPDGSDWSLGDWSNAVLGELGEAANLIKKIQRGDRTLDGAREELAKEFADVVTYLDILAFRAGVDLGAATAAKWDEVSERVGVPLRIGDFAPSVHEALASIGIHWMPESEAGEGYASWTTVTEPNGEEPADTLADALKTMLSAAEHDGMKAEREAVVAYLNSESQGRFVDSTPATPSEAMRGCEFQISIGSHRSTATTEATTEASSAV